MPVRALSPPSYGDPLSGVKKMYQADLVYQAQETKRLENQAKSTVASLISSYNSAKSQALQEEIINSMKSYQSSLPSALRKAIEPYIAHGPTSPMAEKRREFLSQFPYPTRPALNEASGDTAEAENQAMMISYKFAASDHDRAMQIFMGGEAMAPDKLSFIYNADGSAAIRSKDGMINILTPQDLDLKSLEEKYNISSKDLILNGGVIPTGKKGFMQVNGRKITTESLFKPFAPDGEKYGSRVINVESMPKSQWDISHSAKLINTMMEWKMDSPSDKAVKELKKRALKGEAEMREVERDMRTFFPQYSFRILRPKKENIFKRIANILPFVSADENMALIPIRGEPITLPNSQGTLMQVWYDADLDMVSNKWGIPIGNYQTASTLIKAK